MYHEFYILKKKGYNISQIAKITKHDRYTISQYLNKKKQLLLGIPKIIIINIFQI